MSTYTIPLSIAFFTFAIIAFIGTIPWTVYQYRKHGYFNFWRNLIIFSFIYYGLTALFLVSLPLPATRDNAIVFKDNVYTQLTPFNMLHNFQEIPGFVPSEFRTYPTLFKSFTFLEVFFNIALLLPLGIYLRYFFKSAKKWWMALILIFSTTLFFEVSQLTALFGFYAHPYRLFDVDDLLTNTLGGMIGFFIAPLLLNIIPSRDELKKQDQDYAVEKIASYGAQILELCINLMVSKLMATLISICFFKGNDLFYVEAVIGFFFIVIYPLFAKGKTIGGYVVKIKFDLRGKKDVFPLCYRYLLVYFPIALSYLTNITNQHESIGLPIVSLQIMLFIGSLGVRVIFLLILIRDWMKKKEEPFFNRKISVQMKRY